MAAAKYASEGVVDLLLARGAEDMILRNDRHDDSALTYAYRRREDKTSKTQGQISEDRSIHGKLNTAYHKSHALAHPLQVRLRGRGDVQNQQAALRAGTGTYEQGATASFDSNQEVMSEGSETDVAVSLD